MRAEALCGVAVLAAAGSAVGQCTYSTSMVDTFSASPPRFGQQQSPASGWTFARSTSGTDSVLLTGFENASWRGSAWASPDLAYAIPAAGPRFSPDPARNQNDFHRRDPSFEGLMLHPGYGLMHARAALAPQSTTNLSSLTVRAEHLGTASPTAVVTVTLLRSGGSPQTLIAPTTITSLAAAVALTPSAGILPLTLAPGDRVYVESSDGGGPEEDWLNVEMSATLAGAPLIASQPAVTANCDTGATATLVAAGATSYRWRRQGVDVVNGPTASGSVISGATTAELRIEGFGPADADLYDCVVSNTCGSVTTVETPINRCFTDFNCDGFLDFFDYDSFVTAFETGDTRSDFNGDGFLDFFDYDDFVRTFEVGC